MKIIAIEVNAAGGGGLIIREKPVCNVAPCRLVC